jgi:hypothetical protein
MWWLYYRNEGKLMGLAIIEAPSLLHALIRAEVRGIGRGVDYIEGKEIDAEHAALVPPDCIGGLLSHAPTEPTDGAIKRLRPTSVFAGVTGDRAPWSAIISSR